ncbi:MAG: M20/M25/M40 family metallo-hydrolase [Clostridia bacterium]|nr:M20/M25/M40 family metallo-hydrolase [Clostridia bacterium]
MELFDLMKKLTDCDGTSGDETNAAAVAKAELEKYMPCEIDRMGSVVGSTGAVGQPILLDAHLDQIGLIVTAIDETGFLKITACGGADALVLAAAEVTVHGKENLPGIIVSTPPHLIKEDERKKARKITELSVDLGLTKEEAEQKVAVGDRITLNAPLKKMLNERVCGASLDDRCGVASLLLCLERLGDLVKELPLRVVFSANEETGGSGAKVAAYSAGASEAIAVDVSFAKAPGVKETVRAKLGKGTMIGFAPTLDHAMSKELQRLAEEGNIPYQFEVMSGRTGTNADDIATAGHGAKMALLSIPLRNMHTAAEVIDLRDVEATADLMAAYLKNKAVKKDA